MFDADRPILHSDQDLLDRATFAKYLARCMLDHHSLESLVLGLEGSGGSGKTSLINLILEELRYASSNMFDNERPIILNFSPWSYSGQKQLIYGFFRRLSSEMRQCDYLENSDRMIHLLELYASFFTQQPVPKSLRARMRFGRKGDGYAWESGRDPIQVKTELNRVLSQQKHKIIIIIDNISRLEAQEINQILQIVKSMADYMNTIYLLSFDKEPVVNAINSIHPGEGQEYLTKLIQLPFEIPAISKQNLENLLNPKLEKIVAILPPNTWHSNDWANMYYTGVKHFFKDSRDVTRYINALSFSFPRVKDVVNPVDFFALTAIQVFAPTVFYGIRDNKDLFTDLLEGVYVLDEDKLKKDRQRCDEILQREGGMSPEVLLHLLMLIFPRLFNLYHVENKIYHSESLARQKLRACCPDMFDIYFRLSIPSGVMTAAEFEAFLDLSNDESSFSQGLLRLNQDNRVTHLLALLDGSATHRIYKTNIGNVISALLDCADLFPEEKISVLNVDTEMRIYRICQQLLQHFAESKERFQLTLAAIQNSDKSLFILVHIVNCLSAQHDDKNDAFLPTEQRLVNTQELAALQQAVVAKIRYWAEIGRLSEHPKLFPILRAWQTWGNSADVMQFVTETVSQDRGLVAFLLAALKKPIAHTMAKLEKEANWETYLEPMAELVSLQVLEEQAQQIFSNPGFEKLREPEQLAILIFLDLVNSGAVKSL